MGGLGPTWWIFLITVVELTTAGSAHAFGAATPRRSPVSVGGYLEGYRIVEVDRATPQQRPAGILDLQLHGELTPDVRFFVESRGIVGGTPAHASGFGIFNLRNSFQNHSPSVELEEAYVDWRYGDLEVRAGKQKFAWGQLDLFRPTDVLNPRRYNDPFIVEDEEAKIGIPSIDLSYSVPPQFLDGAIRASVVWVPIPVSFRFPLEDERWFPSSANLPEEVVIPADFFGLNSGATIHPVLHTQNAPPPMQLDEGAVALRLGGTWNDAQWTLSAYDGQETAPGLGLSTVVYSPSARQKIAAGQRPTIPDGDLQGLIANAVLRPRSRRVQVIGGDLAFAWDGFTTRIEAAYGFNRLIPRSTRDLLTLENIRAQVGPQILPIVETILQGKDAAVDLGALFVERDRFEWGAGIDYAIAGWIPVVQLNQSILLNHDSRKLLVAETDTRILLAVRKLLFDDRFKIDLVAFQGIERSYTTGIARFSFALTDQLRLRFGYVLIAGTRESVVGQYHDLDEAFLQMRYSF